MASQPALPATHKALLFHSTDQPLQLTELPTPTASTGSAVVEVEVAGILSYNRDIVTGKRPYPYPTPYVPGPAAIGRVVDVGADATALRVGDLVLADTFLIGRDDINARALQGVHQGASQGSARLVENEWRHGSWAEYVKAPLENCHRLPESKDGKSVVQWLNMNRMMVPFGGLTNEGGLDLRPGEAVVIAPATGQFGGAAVEAALAMGARVVALGRNPESLQKLDADLSQYGSRFRTVQITGDIDADAKAIGPVDGYLDISPPSVGDSTHGRSCFQALKPRGRICLMGGMADNIVFPQSRVVREGITITGKWMYERSAASKLISLADAGLLDLTRYTHDEFAFGQWEEALKNAETKNKRGQFSVFKPSLAS